MRVTMTNFHNIASLSYEIEDNRVNFLYGISGSGKSSIVKGIAQTIDSNIDTMVGCNPEETAVLIDGKSGPLESAVTFDQNRRRILFSRDPDKGFYDLFIGNERELDSLRGQYFVAVSSLRLKIGDLLRLKSEIEALAKTLGKTTKMVLQILRKWGRLTRHTTKQRRQRGNI